MLRPYQQEAVNAIWNYIREHDDHPVVELPTAAGKSWIIAQIVKDAVLRWNGRVIVLAHVKELLEQNAEKIMRLCPEIPIGIYSAGLGKKEIDKPVIVAGIQSVYRRACDLGAFNLAIIDEVHLVPLKGEGMYRTFIKEAKVVNPHIRLIGLTATPFRLDAGPICRPDGIFQSICYKVGIKELIRDGYLCPLVTKAGIPAPDFDKLHVRGGEYVAEEVEALMSDEALIQASCKEIYGYTQDRKSVLVFSSGVQHGRQIAAVLEQFAPGQVGFIYGEMSASQRAELIARFRGNPETGLFPPNPIKYLVNVNVLTTGFDAPNIDCVAILRPTLSPGLWYQMCGRGFRLFPGKENCLILDFGGNALRHGPVDCLRMPHASGNGDGLPPAKKCPECQSVIHAGYSLCPYCGFEFPPPERSKHAPYASTAEVLSGEPVDTEYEVLDVFYSVHVKRKAPPDAPRTMRVDYQISELQWVSEWVCLEHEGYPRYKAEQWWKQRALDPVPDTVDLAVRLAEIGRVARPTKIKVRRINGEKFPRIIGYEFEPLPEPSYSMEDDLEDVPF